jgi:transposase-like protein
MKVSEARQAYRFEERMRLVREQRESGLTVRAWCCENNIKESSFYYWLRETRKAALQINEAKKPEAEHALVRVELPARVTSDAGSVPCSAIRLQYKGVMLDIPPGTRAEDLSLVLKVLDGT